MQEAKAPLEELSKKIGFIGLSNMGEPMATNIAKAGFDLTVYDIRPEPLRALEKLGATVASSTQVHRGG